MSDLFTDSARDEERLNRIMAYIAVLKSFLSDPTYEKRTVVIEAARYLDSYDHNSFCTESTFESVGIEERLDKLAEGDTQAWAKFLGRFNEGPVLEEFKALSPIHKRHKNN